MSACWLDIADCSVCLAWNPHRGLQRLSDLEPLLISSRVIAWVALCYCAWCHFCVCWYQLSIVSMLRTLGRSLFVVQHGVHQLGVHNWCLYIYTWFSFELERIQSPGQCVYQRMSAWQRLRMRRPTSTCLGLYLGGGGRKVRRKNLGVRGEYFLGFVCLQV